jgi:transcriptional regulator with XRE-family HTH domain
MTESPKRPKIVGNFIRQRRETLNLSQRALGLLFDPPVTTQFISNVERGVTPLPPAHVPTLTKALQVSESEMMGLLEKEYTLKLCGRLGLPNETQVPRGAVVIPMSSAVPAHASLASSNLPHLPVSAPDYEFIQSLYEAYRTADPKTRQTFAGLCQTVLGLRAAPIAASGATAVATALQATTGSIALSSGDRSQS